MAEPLKADGHEFRSKCSISRTLELLGDKWTLLIVRDLMWHDKHTFQALQGSAEKIPTNILADRLARLEEYGLVTKSPYQQNPLRHQYHLTRRGADMLPVLQAMGAWGYAHIDGSLPLPDWFTSARPQDYYPAGD